MDKVIHTLSTYPVIEKSRKLKLYTKLSTLSTFDVCGILDLHKEKRTDVLYKMINRHFWTKKSSNLLTFLYSKKRIILYKKDKI